MANKNQKPQNASATTTAPQVENPVEDKTMDEIRSQNIGEASLTVLANQQIKDEQNKRLVEDKKRKILEAQYVNMKARLMLRARRREERATKEYLTETKDLLDQLTGVVDDKGKVVSETTLTIFQYEEKRREIRKKKDDAFRESSKQFDEEMKELRYQYPNYWSYEWDN